MSWPSKDPDSYFGRGSFSFGWVLPAVAAGAAAMLAVAVSDLVAGMTGLLLGALALVAPLPLLRRQGRSWAASTAAVVLAAVLAALLITLALHALLGHVGDARRWA